MQIGKLDRRIKIRGKSLIDDGLRQKEHWADLRTVWANVSYLSDTQRFIAGSSGRDLKIRFTIRHIPGIDISHENMIEFDNRPYVIDGAKPYKDDLNFIEITAGLAKVNK